MKKMRITGCSLCAAVIVFGCAMTAPAGDAANDIARYESAGELAVDPTETVVEAPKDMKLILCIGQSNMAGRGRMTPADREVVEGAYKLNRDGKWVKARSPYHFDRTYAAVGPVDEFVKLYLREHPGDTVGVVPCAVGGSAMATWQDDPSGRRGENLRRALERAKIASRNGKFIAVLWHQGETDAAKYGADALMKTYPGRVKAMMERIRRELGERELPLVVGEIGRWWRRDGKNKDGTPRYVDHAARINPCLEAVTAALPRSALVSSEGLKNQDAHHFNRDGQRILGTRYYEAWKKLARDSEGKRD